jgi:vacuolar-type H+-ATPase subunit H
MSDASIRVMALLDELEDILTNASKVPFSDKAIVDGDEIASIIEDIRISMPKDIQQAKWVKDEQDRILNEARNEYDKVIDAAKKQAEYLVENDVIKREAEKRADAILSEAENHSRYIKLRAYEYIDKMLYDMQNDIASVAGDYIQPMNDYFTEMLGDINERVNSNRKDMKTMAEKIQGAASEEGQKSHQQYDYDEADYDGQDEEGQDEQ